MNLPPSAAAPAPPSSAPRRDWPRRLVNAAVTLVVLAVAAATFVLSYAGVHAIALQGGVSVQLARIYPGLFDAVLVIACVAAVVLRDGRWWARCWAWLVVIVILGAIGATDVLHATNYALRHRLTEGVVAAAPVVAVLLAFSLLLTMLRQSRPQASERAPEPAGTGCPPRSQAVDRSGGCHPDRRHPDRRGPDRRGPDRRGPGRGGGRGAPSARAGAPPARAARRPAARARPLPKRRTSPKQMRIRHPTDPPRLRRHRKYPSGGSRE